MSKKIMKIENALRMSFLPTFFKESHLIFESVVYHIASSLDADYTGGYWEYATCGDTPLMYCESITEVRNPFSGHVAKVDNVLAGAIINIYALSLILESNQIPLLTRRYDSLVEFAYEYGKEKGLGGEVYAMLD